MPYKKHRKANYPTYQLFFIVTLALFIYVIWSELSYLLVPFLWSIILYVIFQKFYNKLVENKKWKPMWATLFIFLLSSIPIVVFATIFSVFIYPQIEYVIYNFGTIRDNFLVVAQKIEDRLNIHILTKENIISFSASLSQYIKPLLGSASEMFTNFSFTYFFAYFIFVYNRSIKAWMLHTLPFGKEKNLSMITEINTLVFGGVISIPLVAILQGLLALIGYAIFKVDYFIVLGLLTGLASVIPIIGTMIIYFPLAIYYFILGENVIGIEILIWGVVVISSSDNVIRIYLSKRISNMSALVSMLGFLLGTSLFGLSGLIFGPVLLTIFIKLIQIYQKEFSVINEPRQKKQKIETIEKIDIDDRIADNDTIVNKIQE